MKLTTPQIAALKQMQRNMEFRNGEAPLSRVILNQLIKKGLATDTERTFEFKLSYASGKSAKSPVGAITLLGLNVLAQELASQVQQRAV